MFDNITQEENNNYAYNLDPNINCQNKIILGGIKKDKINKKMHYNYKNLDINDLRNEEKKNILNRDNNIPNISNLKIIINNNLKCELNSDMIKDVNKQKIIDDGNSLLIIKSTNENNIYMKDEENKNYNKPHSLEKNKISKFYRSYTFNLEKSEFPNNTSNLSKSPHNQNVNKKFIHPFNIIMNTNVVSPIKRKISKGNSYLDLESQNNNNQIPSNPSQKDLLISDDSFALKQTPKNTYQNFINKYNEKKDKIIHYYILLNNKIMLYFKNECKSQYRGLHYLSDNFSTVDYDKTNFIISNGVKYYYLNLNIKESVKLFVSKNEFEMRKWFEVFKKTINPHKSRQLKEYYNLKETICEGKYGVVKRATNKKTKKEVSIKIVNIKNLGCRKKIELIYKEIEILRHCNNPSILKYIDHFIEINEQHNKSYIHIAMEYLSGGDLAAYIHKLGALHESRVIRLAWDIAKGLEYLHNLGIVHRDIKPENIVFDQMQNPRIVDFGLSEIIGFNEYLTESYGTYYYASPEVHKKTKYNKSTDIWSFGILIFYILTYDLPFLRDKDQSHLIIADLDNEFDLDSNFIFANSSSFLKDLVRKCLKKKMEERLNINQIIHHKVFSKYNREKK